jgi:hypothetical protein
MRPDGVVGEDVLAAGTSDLLTRGLGSQSRFVQSGVITVSIWYTKKRGPKWQGLSDIANTDLTESLLQQL